MEAREVILRPMITEKAMLAEDSKNTLLKLTFAQTKLTSNKQLKKSLA